MSVCIQMVLRGQPPVAVLTWLPIAGRRGLHVEALVAATVVKLEGRALLPTTAFPYSA
jgi:hypothetical protein